MYLSSPFQEGHGWILSSTVSTFCDNSGSGELLFTAYISPKRKIIHREATKDHIIRKEDAKLMVHLQPILVLNSEQHCSS